MVGRVRGLMRVESALVTEYGRTIKMSAQYSNNPEDNSYSEATPSATFEMHVSNKAAAEFFVPGKRFYVDFSPAPDL